MNDDSILGQILSEFDGIDRRNFGRRPVPELEVEQVTEQETLFQHPYKLEQFIRTDSAVELGRYR